MSDPAEMVTPSPGLRWDVRSKGFRLRLPGPREPLRQRQVLVPMGVDAPLLKVKVVFSNPQLRKCTSVCPTLSAMETGQREAPVLYWRKQHQ